MTVAKWSLCCTAVELTKCVMGFLQKCRFLFYLFVFFPHFVEVWWLVSGNLKQYLLSTFSENQFVHTSWIRLKIKDCLTQTILRQHIHLTSKRSFVNYMLHILHFFDPEKRMLLRFFFSKGKTTLSEPNVHEGPAAEEVKENWHSESAPNDVFGVAQLN